MSPKKQINLMQIETKLPGWILDPDTIFVLENPRFLTVRKVLGLSHALGVDAYVSWLKLEKNRQTRLKRPSVP